MPDYGLGGGGGGGERASKGGGGGGGGGGESFKKGGEVDLPTDSDTHSFWCHVTLQR